MDNIILMILLGLILFFLIQLALRWFNCWYWKINHRLHTLEDMSAALRSANQTLQETNRAMQDVRALLLTQNGQVPVNTTPAPPAAPTPPPAASAEDNIPDL